MARIEPAQLERIAVFGGLAPQTVDRLLEAAPLVRRDTDESFFRAGDQGTSMFVLHSGQVRVVKRVCDEEVELFRGEPGYCFGEVALLGCTPRTASVVAAQPSSAWEISYSALHDLYRDDIEQYLIIQMNLARELARRLQDADARCLE
ncbi:MAG: cyclic nucleotide-binding domain-containing protein, partial [Gammaproteobacteria bacterium]|nr:cyclic nucleotide-binding domain-containing protein [Gammaproteobacteria bacterium]